MNLRLIACGGTFDKRYDPLTGALGFGDTHLPDLLRHARLAPGLALEPLMQIDSLDMTDAHRQRVLEACRAAPESRIVIVHGTDTLVDTARVLAQARLARTIVLTGAMVPCDLADSDALFNLGHAIGAAQQLAPGVWIAMHACVFAWDQVRKNRERGLFEAA